MTAGSPRVVAFDLDDTLAVSKSKIERRMASLLEQLLGQVDVCIISGGKFEQFEAQVLRCLHADQRSLERLHIMPTCGTRYYRWKNGGAWRLIYGEDLSPAEKSQVISALMEEAKKLGFWEPSPWGDIIEDRGSQITYSALGQAAPVEAKYAWDPDGSKKRCLRDHVADRLPDLEVRVGGSTSVDVTRKGIDKAYGIRRLMEQLNVSTHEIVFVGDRLQEGGNDYPVKALGIHCVEVSRWQDTADYIECFLQGLAL
jgi:HAD superfamily hydrolase (TIGR01484 family)